MRSLWTLSLLSAGIFTCVGILHAQSSPQPAITGYGNTSLASQGPDSTFCKGQTLTIQGQYFQRTQGGESWDTTHVFLDGLNVQAPVISMSVSGNGQNDQMTIELPDLWQADTCLTITLIKQTSWGAFSFTYTTTDTICLIGDWVQVNYPDTLFCVNEPNPLPTINLGPSTTGSFCCENGAPGFAVQPSGEILLNTSAIGQNNTFQYITTHPQCPDTLGFSVDILANSTSTASYNGQTTVDFCQSMDWFPVADSTSLVPNGGWFGAAPGLVLLDSFSGMIDVQASTPGSYVLNYFPNQPCYDTATVQVTISAPDSVVVAYPGITYQNGFPHLCTDDAPQYPVFPIGGGGGSFYSDPAGLSLGSFGEIQPSNSNSGSYNLWYITPDCPDTMLVLAGLQVDSVYATSMQTNGTIFCPGDTIRVDSLVAPSGGQLQLLRNDTIIWSGLSSGTPPVGNAGSHVLRYVFSGFPCLDTPKVNLTVLPRQDPNWSYAAPSFCLGDPDPAPLNIASPGGSFLAVSSATVVSNSGVLNLSQSGPGMHTIRYVTSGPCPDSLERTVQILSAASGQFAYNSSTFCTADSNPIPQIFGAQGGHFTSDSTLQIDSLTGEIHVNNSQSGPHNITYTLTQGCATNYSQTITILESDSLTSFAYPTDSFCTGTGPHIPIITGDSIGTFTASAGLSPTTNGQLDLVGIAPGTYTIYYDLQNPCATDPQTVITVLPPDDAHFTYPVSEICQGSGTLHPNSITLPGGTFTEPTNSLNPDSLGRIDLGQSPAGQFQIRYTTSGHCPASSTQDLLIWPKPLATDIQALPDWTVCQGTPQTFTALGVNVSDYQFLHNNHSKSTSDRYAPDPDSLTHGDTITAILTTSQGCADTVSQTLTLIPAPEILVLDDNGLNIGEEPLRIGLDASLPGTTIHWKAMAEGNIYLDADSGQIQTPNTLAIPIEMRDRTKASRLWLTLHPTTGTCPGKTDSLDFVINETDQAIFVAEVMTPNGDNANDTWIIQWHASINPRFYTLHLFNRSGGKVLTMNPIHEQWNGGNLPDGVYWWVLEDRDGYKVNTGGLTIRRK